MKILQCTTLQFKNDLLDQMKKVIDACKMHVDKLCKYEC